MTTMTGDQLRMCRRLEKILKDLKEGLYGLGDDIDDLALEDKLNEVTLA